MIYAIEALGLRRVKLGYSKTEHTFVWRYQSVDIHCPTEITVAGVWPDASRADERALHRKWASCHLKGEWFDLSPALESFISMHFEPFTITREMKALALFLRTRKRAEMPLLVDDERFVSIEDVNVHYEAGQEAWVIATEEADRTTSAIGRRAREPVEALQVASLRSEGYSFRDIAERVGKSEEAVKKAYYRSLKGKRAA